MRQTPACAPFKVPLPASRLRRSATLSRSGRGEEAPPSRRDGRSDSEPFRICGDKPDWLLRADWRRQVERSAAMSPLPERERVPSEGEAGEGLAANAGMRTLQSPSPGFAPVALSHPLPFGRGERGAALAVSPGDPAWQGCPPHRDGRDKPGHDSRRVSKTYPASPSLFAALLNAMSARTASSSVSVSSQCPASSAFSNG